MTKQELAGAGVDVPIVFDWDGAIARQLQVEVLGVILVDAEGRVVTTWKITPSEPTAAEVEAALDPLLASSPAPSPEP